jgi:uncharacterized protein YndB with AHSA1/START domain
MRGRGLTAEETTMTTQKDFKRLVRGRMQKTGESYTAARATLLAQSVRRKAPTAASNGHGALEAPVASTPPAPKPAAFAKIAGMSDEKVKEKTGCTWERWVWALDQVDAHQWPHSEIAEYVSEKYKVPGWWSQMVTVGYERIRGLREKGQRRSGSWEASKSRTINASVSALFKAFRQPKQRASWLPARVVVRSASPNKSVRMTWPDGTAVQAYFESKGRSKALVSIQHTKLESREAVDRMKETWSGHLTALAEKVEKQKAR